MICIILNETEKLEVEGLSSPISKLEPRLLNDGKYALPSRVLQDPAHEPKWAQLSQYPQRDVDLSEFYSEEI